MSSETTSQPPGSGETRRARDRRRRRTPNACTRCRQQKIKCSGIHPCEHCQKRNLPCTFDPRQQKVFVTRELLADLERQAADSRRASEIVPQEPLSERTHGAGSVSIGDDTMADVEPQTPLVARDDVDRPHVDQQLEFNHGSSRAASSSEEQRLTNPLVAGNSTYTASTTGQSLYLGTSSNWSFGRRLLALAHEKVYGGPLPKTNLLFDGETYDLGWDGRRTHVDLDNVPLPTADFALYLINAVKFHCSQLFHLFDEELFMQNFGSLHESADGYRNCSDLWIVHYLLILALGKALIVPIGREKQPPGAELFVQAMKLLPDTTFLTTEPLQAIEVLCCTAMYLQCLDLRISAHNFIGQAMRLSLSFGLHTDMPESRHHSDSMLERCREIWWTVYILDCHMSALLGIPFTLNEQEISARLPALGNSPLRAHALDVQVRLAQVTASILRTIYSRESRPGSNNFIGSMRAALKWLAEINDERMSRFHLQINPPASGISRLSAHLHLFYHQCIILAIKPLLFGFFQRSLDVAASVPISSTGSVRALAQVCVSSAHQSLKILDTLRSQSLLESFIPFDLESVWSAALVLIIVDLVDSSMSENNEFSLQIAYAVLDEMISRGNRIAAYRKNELTQLQATLQACGSSTVQTTYYTADSTSGGHSSDFPGGDTINQPLSNHMQADWRFETGHLEAVANSLDLADLDWLCVDSLNQLDPSLL